MPDTPLPSTPVAVTIQNAQPGRVSSAELLRGQSTVEIEHAGQRYWLRVTRENKLILTK